MRVVLDWDGTVTEVDGLHLVLDAFGDPEVFGEAERQLGRGLTLYEVIARELATVRAPLHDVVGWVREHVRVRAGFAEFARRRRPLVLSSGFHELIEPVLEREGVALEVRANRLDPRPDGWRVLVRDEAACSVCGEPCKRAAVADHVPFVYVGDGFSDRCVSQLAERVFARDGLAAYLAARSLPFEPFTDFRDLDARLDGRAG